MLKTFPSDKINGAKNALFFLSQAPTHHIFTFNLRFLYELKHKVRLCKTVFGIFHLRFRFAFIKVYNFVQQNILTLWLRTLFNIKVTEKPDTVLRPDLWFLSCNRKFWCFKLKKSFWEGKVLRTSVFFNGNF